MKHSVHEIVLDNGSRGLLLDIPQATVMSMEFNFRAGDYQSPKGKWDVAHTLEHMVLGANKRFPKARLFNSEFTKNGAYSNASTTAYDLNYIAECADFEWRRIVGLLLEAIQEPLLPKDEFEAEIGNVREELTGDLNHYFRQLLISARVQHGLTALEDVKRLKQLSNISLADVKQFYHRTHQSANLRFVIAGNLKGRHGELEKLFAGLTLAKGSRKDLPLDVAQPFKRVYYLERPALKNIYFLWHTFASRELEPHQSDALKLVNVMLTETLHSKILGAAREQGLAYDIMSHFNIFREVSDWWFGAEIRAENVLRVFDITTEEIRRIRHGKIEQKDVSAAKKYMIGRHQRSVQTPRSLMKLYSSEYFFNERIRDYNMYEDWVNAISRKRMSEVVEMMFQSRVGGLSVLATRQHKLAEEMNKNLRKLWE